MNNVTIHFDSTTRLLTINGQSCQLADFNPSPSLSAVSTKLPGS
jgi:hypothetical protein